MEIFDLCAKGKVKVLWISGTTPAVSLPELARIRATLGDDRLFVVAQDLFPTGTTAFADVVLLAATWGEKTGVITNADRTVHLCEQAVEPPGQARSDLNIFLAFARAMDLRDRDGAPLVSWQDPESAYRAWQRASAGRPCDYTTISYEDLRREGGIQWGGERLYGDGRFPFAGADQSETYAKDLVTGDPFDADAYRAFNPDGRAMLRSAAATPAEEPPQTDHPLRLITGRTVYHFHTRTKTGRTPELAAAAPEVWAELSHADAAALGVADGDRVRVRTARGAVVAPARVTDIREGVVFVPFHYGYWDAGRKQGRDHDRAANELTPTAWDPVSKQPLFKSGAAAVERA